MREERHTDASRLQFINHRRRRRRRHCDEEAAARASAPPQASPLLVALNRRSTGLKRARSQFNRLVVGARAGARLTRNCDYYRAPLALRLPFWLSGGSDGGGCDAICARAKRENYALNLSLNLYSCFYVRVRLVAAV